MCQGRISVQKETGLSIYRFKTRLARADTLLTGSTSQIVVCLSQASNAIQTMIPVRFVFHQQYAKHQIPEPINRIPSSPAVPIQNLPDCLPIFSVFSTHKYHHIAYIPLTLRQMPITHHFIFISAIDAMEFRKHYVVGRPWLLTVHSRKSSFQDL